MNAQELFELERTMRSMRTISALAFLLLCACTDCGTWVYHRDGTYGPWWWHDKATHADSRDWSHPSDSAPEALKPYYDAGLTQALNR